MYRLLLAVVALVSFVIPAYTDRPVTEDERTKIIAAVAAAGCLGGKMEFDDGEFEVDDAICDGRKYDLKFNTAFELIKKKLED